MEATIAANRTDMALVYSKRHASLRAALPRFAGERPTFAVVPAPRHEAGVARGQRT